MTFDFKTKKFLWSALFLIGLDIALFALLVGYYGGLTLAAQRGWIVILVATLAGIPPLFAALFTKRRP